jgi:hypothetical protein
MIFNEMSTIKFKSDWTDFYVEQTKQFIDILNDSTRYDELEPFLYTIVTDLQAILNNKDGRRFIIQFVEGNIGVGKTTYLKSRENEHRSQIISVIIDEPIELWQKIVVD